MPHKYIPLLLLIVVTTTWGTYFFTLSDYEGKPKEAEIVATMDSTSVSDSNTTPVIPLPVDAVKQVTHKEIVGPKYTIRNGLGGSRKNIPTPTGLTKDERAKEFLATAGIAHTLPTWKRLGEKYKIDYTLPIAIAWADSHLGLALKSKNNIGNIGNNDRGDTREYSTLEEGIESIFWHLAHGKYMKGHVIIGTMSGEGRIRMGIESCNANRQLTKKCYASSKEYWSTNVVNAMSVIHNKQVDESFLFRL